MHREQLCEIVTQQSWVCLFAVFPPLFFHFSCLIFFSCWALSRLHFGEKVFGKAFRILVLDERKGGWVVKQDFHGNFWVNVTWFFAFFSGLLDWTVPILVWFERSLHSEQGSGQSCPWPLKLMMSQAIEGTCICTVGLRKTVETDVDPLLLCASSWVPKASNRWKHLASCFHLFLCDWNP